MLLRTGIEIERYARVVQRMMLHRNYTPLAALPYRSDLTVVHEDTTTTMLREEDQIIEQSTNANIITTTTTADQLVQWGHASLQGTTRVGRVMVLFLPNGKCDTRYIQRLLSSLSLLPAADSRPQHLFLALEVPLHPTCFKKLSESPFRVEIFLYHELSFVLVDHHEVPQHRIMTKSEARALIEDKCAHKRRQAINAGRPTGIPACTTTTCFCFSYINVNEPVARYYYMRPNDMVVVTEPSDTVGWTLHYSVVVQEGNML